MGCKKGASLPLQTTATHTDETKPLDTFRDSENNKSFTPANKLNKAWHLGKVNGVECKLQSLSNAGGVCDSKEQAGETPARSQAEAPLTRLWVTRRMTSTSHLGNFLH